MKKLELIEAIAAKVDIPKTVADKSIEALIEIVITEVASGHDVIINGFGTFKAAAREARKGTNPKTGEALEIAATTVPKFAAATAFKTAVAR